MDERYNETTLDLAELTGCFECKQCGAVVRDIVAHDDWHDRYQEMLNLFTEACGNIDVIAERLGLRA